MLYLFHSLFKVKVLHSLMRANMVKAILVVIATGAMIQGNVSGGEEG